MAETLPLMLYLLYSTVQGVAVMWWTDEHKREGWGEIVFFILLAPVITLYLVFGGLTKRLWKSTKEPGNGTGN